MSPIMCAALLSGSAAPLVAEAEVSNGFVVIATICIMAMALVLLVGLFGPGLRYPITDHRPPDGRWSRCYNARLP